MDNSTFEHQTENGVPDLCARGCGRNAIEHSFAWLIETNQYPPGMKGSESIEYIHGVGCRGHSLLIAISDKQRMRPLSHPFQKKNP